MNENEIWRDIEGYEGLYQVSNLGRVKSLGNDKTKKEKILKFGKNKDGYLFVVLCKEGKRKNYTIHRLVANAFIKNPSNLTCINHIDEDKTNNLVSNLEWCDIAYNNMYGSRIKKAVENTDWKSVGRKLAEKLTNRQDLSKQVFQYTKNGELVGIWESTRECGRNGYSQGHVAACCRGELKTHRGYIWSYTELKKQES